MKEIFEEKLEEIVSTAKNGADSLKQNVSLRKKIREVEDSIAVSMYDLGCETYEGKISGETDEESIDMLVAEIQEQRKKLASLRSELNALNGKTECPSCGKVTSTDFDFCPFCGAKLYDVVMEEDECECDDDCCCDDECCECGCEDCECEACTEETCADECCKESSCECCECGNADECSDTCADEDSECEVEVEITVNDESSDDTVEDAEQPADTDTAE